MIKQLRQLALLQQGLTLQAKFGIGLSGTLNAIEHLGYVQIDTLSVVERAHHHVLWSRVPKYDQTYLNQLIHNQDIFEYWYHAASYLPMRDYRYALPSMNSIRNDENRYYRNVDKYLMNEILARVRIEGPLVARNFENKRTTPSSWWGSGPTRRALDKLFMQGDLMICARNGMEKVYDLTERCLPSNIDLRTPTIREYASYLFETTRRAHGAFTLKQLLHLKTDKLLQKVMLEILDENIQMGIIKAINSQDVPRIYVDRQLLEQIPANEKVLKILSPFDNALIHRDRLSSLFKFDYRIECYVSAPKRIFGYFCLPILYGNEFVGRIDCKAHRASQRLEIISLHWEDNKLDREEILSLLNFELQEFANFNKCPLLDKI